jgi:hypothetical protein
MSETLSHYSASTSIPSHVNSAAAKCTLPTSVEHFSPVLAVRPPLAVPVSGIMDQLPTVVSVQAFSNSGASVETVTYRGYMSSSIKQEETIQNAEDKTVLSDGHIGNIASSNQLVRPVSAPMSSVSLSCSAQSAQSSSSVRQNDGIVTFQPLPVPAQSSTVSVDSFPLNKV